MRQANIPPSGGSPVLLLHGPQPVPTLELCNLFIVDQDDVFDLLCQLWASLLEETGDDAQWMVVQRSLMNFEAFAKFTCFPYEKMYRHALCCPARCHVPCARGPCHALLCHVAALHSAALPCLTIPCDAMPGYARLRHALLCSATPSPPPFPTHPTGSTSTWQQ